MERHGDLMEPSQLARRSDPLTSHEAAARVKEFAPRQRDRILEVLDKHPKGCGAEQIGYWLDIEPYAVRKRLSELEKKWELAKPIKGAFRLTISGRPERLWRAT